MIAVSGGLYLESSQSEDGEDLFFDVPKGRTATNGLKLLGSRFRLKMRKRNGLLFTVVGFPSMEVSSPRLMLTCPGY